MDAHDADVRTAVMTSAVRDAANGAQFADAVRERYGLTGRTLSGDEEARLSFLGATSTRAGDGALLVIDIGGGSTEMVEGAGGEVEFHVSTQVGVVRHSERHLRSDPPTAGELAALTEEVERAFAAAVPARERALVAAAVAVAGTATQAAGVDRGAEGLDVEGHRLSAERLRAMLEQLASLPLERRREVPGLDPDRAPTIVAGVVILVEAMRAFDLDRIAVSEHDILYGAALEATRSPA
jgi:exopolyphosphatase/guanosine-5'-triphosphate,3'-diphosphate pyrophosphatase